MANVSIPSHAPAVRREEHVVARTPARLAYDILHVAFIVAPVVAGLDKFTHYLVNWDQYLSRTFASLSPLPTHTLMLVVGVIEIVAGLIVAVKPKIGGVVVALWLAGIIVNLLLSATFFDIALRDFGLLLGALALANLARAKERGDLDVPTREVIVER